MKGIDVSHWNGDPFNAVTQKAYKESDFCITKLTNGIKYEYANYGIKIIEKALADEKLAGAYHYATGAGTPIQEADYFISVVKPFIGKIILALDWESNGNKAWGKITWCKQFIDRVKEQTGVTCFLYTGLDGIRQNKELANKVPLWFAGYPNHADSWTVPQWKYNISPWDKYAIWQYTDGNGKVDRNTTTITRQEWLEYQEVNDMAVRIGSARIDENGKAMGGKAGDQTGKEVAIENWYNHRLGWIVIRAKNDVVREKIAQDMEWACANKNIGYDQAQNQTLWQVASKVKWNCSRVGVVCETDCARLVRVCVSYAVGKAVPDFYTATETAVLRGTGYFNILTAAKYCKSSDYLLRGDILVTKTKGHTVVVLDNGSKVKSASSSSSGGSSVAVGVAESNVRAFKKFLNTSYPSYVKKATGGVLLADNASYTKTTRNAALTVWKYMANKYYKGGLTIGNLNFLAECKAVSGRITTAECKKHITLVKIVQGILSGMKFYEGAFDGIYGTATSGAIKKLQKAHGLAESGNMTADTWYALFNS